MVEGQPDLVSDRKLRRHPNGDFLGWLLAWGKGLKPVVIFIALAILFQLILTYTKYGKHCYAIGSNEEAARMTGDQGRAPQGAGLRHRRHPRLGRGAGAVAPRTSRPRPAWACMYELDAIAMAVIGGVSLSGGRGSIIGTVLGALIFGVIISGFTFMRLDAYYQEMVKGVIIVGAVVLDQWRQQRRAARG